MQGESAQGTVEYVGVLLVVGVLLAAIAATFGVPSSTARLGAAFTQAIVSAFGLSSARGSAHDAPTADDRALFARATDAAASPDDRPSLTDVRLRLIAEHGPDDGRHVYRRLVLDGLKIVPGFGRATLLGTADLQPFGTAISRAVSRARSLSPPVAGDQGELETPTSAPNAHVVTNVEQDAGYAHALHPGVSFGSVALDAASAAPVAGTALGVGRAAVGGARVLARLTSAMSDIGDLSDVSNSLSPSGSAIPPGARAGDIVVSWSAIRRTVSDGATYRVGRTAVVRDGRLLTTSIDVLDPHVP
jgi:hypothetical protein